MRHGEAELQSPGGDFERRLTARGSSDAHQNAVRLSKEGWTPDLVIASTAVRTQQTLEQVRAVIQSSRITSSADLYNCASDDVVAVISDQLQADERVVMIIGHNPGLSILASSLSGDAIGLNPAQVACLTSIDGTSLHEALANGWTATVY